MNKIFSSLPLLIAGFIVGLSVGCTVPTSCTSRAEDREYTVSLGDTVPASQSTSQPVPVKIVEKKVYVIPLDRPFALPELDPNEYQ